MYYVVLIDLLYIDQFLGLFFVQRVKEKAKPGTLILKLPPYNFHLFPIYWGIYNFRKMELLKGNKCSSLFAPLLYAMLIA